MTGRIILIVALLTLLAVLIHCSGGEEDSPEKSGSGGDSGFASEIQPVFSSSCLGPVCHSGRGRAGLVLSQNAYGNLVNVRSTQVPGMWRVRPGKTDSSYVVSKIEGLPGIVGDRMPPPPGAALAPERKQLIKDWIIGGAKDD